MKLRILNDSLRLRLSQTEVQQLADNGRASAAIRFPNGTQLSYTVIHDEAHEKITLSYTENKILLGFPSAQILSWANSSLISIETQNDLNESESIRILLEKDFKCLTDRPNEDESDLFKHPKEGSIKC